MTRTIRLELANPVPVSGNTNIKTVITAWEEATAYFGTATPRRLVIDRQRKRWYHVTIDTSDLLELFAICDAMDAGDKAHFRQRWTHRESLGQRPFGAHVDLTFQAADGHDSEATLHVVGLFIQHWFLAMNIVLPGSFTTVSASYPNEEDQECQPPDLDAAILETAYEHSRKREWPPIRQLPFVPVWDWLQRWLLYDTHIALDPLDRSLFTILRVCEREIHDTDRILLLAQALEGLLAPGKEQISTLLRQRLELVLGVSPIQKNWFSRFYDLRSRIAHGNYPLRRPGNFVSEDLPALDEYIATFFEPTDEAVAVLIALLQDLVAANARQYVFEQQVNRQ